MNERETGFRTVDEYIAAFPEDIQALLQSVRATIRAAAPDAEERIAYRMPTYSQHGNLVHFAALKNHIGFYPTPSGIDAFLADLANYRSTKGAVQFPLGEPLPLDLISRVTQFRVEENNKRAEAKAPRRGK
ncbi:MAG TPA: DUF1801 domain-containing protein [Ktedonobacterales bacterium]